jgi:hypothetical protein
MGTRILIADVIACLLALACSVGPRSGAGLAVPGGDPPAELVEDNFRRAEVALEVRVESVEMVDTLRADNGEIGYGRFRVTATAMEVFKGDVASGSPVTYTFTAEYRPDWQEVWKPGDRWLVFLEGSAEGHGFTVIDEAAEFPSSPSLLETMRSMASSPR